MHYISANMELSERLFSQTQYFSTICIIIKVTLVVTFLKYMDLNIYAEAESPD
jgi:hypothetical protein